MVIWKNLFLYSLSLSRNNELITLKDLIDKSTTRWEETEWEFPKGRRNFKEKDLECALREFEEETGILSSKNEDTELISYPLSKLWKYSKLYISSY